MRKAVCSPERQAGISVRGRRAIRIHNNSCLSKHSVIPFLIISHLKEIALDTSVCNLCDRQAGLIYESGVARRIEVISARILKAISSGVSALISNPMGVWID